MREQSSSTLQAAIRSQGEADGEILTRANVCLASFYDPDLDPATKAGVREGFVRALRDLPTWAVMRGFDNWEWSSTRRPSPAEIRMLAEAELRPITDELARRRRIHDEAEAGCQKREAERVDPATAARILAEAGFTPKRMEAVRRAPMAGSMDQAEATVEAEKPRHWSDAADSDSYQMQALRAARAKNTMITETVAATQARRAKAEAQYP